jgi:RNA polymerase subunit RPABC4/transcription elongation factor Spt4
MRKCSECGRLLNENDNALCPACRATKSHKKKRWTEIIGGIAVTVGSIAIAIITKGKFKG